MSSVAEAAPVSASTEHVAAEIVPEVSGEGKAELVRLLEDHEEWLLTRILAYGKRLAYTDHSSTLREAWRASVKGLTASVTRVLRSRKRPPELECQASYEEDAISRFGVVEAQRHRQRGIPLGMFLGLFKYYRQSYRDLVATSGAPEQRRDAWRVWLDRIFDRIEVAVCVTWCDEDADDRLVEMQRTNRKIANEKNDYLTVFESLSSPVILLDEDGNIRTVNHAAALLVTENALPGALYYGASNLPATGPCAIGADEDRRLSHVTGQPLGAVFPWLADLWPCEPNRSEPVDRSIVISDETRHFHIEVSPMLDVSEKFKGELLILTDITERKRLQEALERQALRDALTGLLNRRAFMDLAEQEVLRARRHHQSLTLLMLDLDHFKRVNDVHGHHAGDKVLQEFAALCRQTIRRSDSVARLGGEEFAILLPQTAPSGASLVAERLQAAIRRARVTCEGTTLSFTASIGMAALLPDDEDIDALLRRADGKLYRAKELGRDRTCF
jgi:diguanylate cyclase (GGDEF)-like protein